MITITDILALTPESMAEATAHDLHAIRTPGIPDGGFAVPDVVWLLVRTVTTGRQAGGLILTSEELADAKRKMTNFLDIAIAGGWRGLDLLETLMAKGVASERLEALARKAGRYCDNRPDLIDGLFKDAFGPDISEFVHRTTTTTPAPEGLAPIGPEVVLRKPMDHHCHLSTDETGEELYFLSAEATLATIAQIGHDPQEAADATDGGCKARHAVDCVLNAAHSVGYSRVDALRQMLTAGPYGRETIAAIEHLTGECGANVIARGLAAAGFNFGGN